MPHAQTECDKGGCIELATHLATIRNPFSEEASTSYQFCSWHTDGARDMSRRYRLGTTFVPLNGAAPKGRAVVAIRSALRKVTAPAAPQTQIPAGRLAEVAT